MSGDLDPLWLETDGRTLVVQMRRARAHLDVSQARVRSLTDIEREHLKRLLSNAGMAAMTGGFESHLLGEIDLYATDLSNAVLLEMPEQRVVLTPDDPRGLIDLLGGAARAESSATLAARPAGGREVASLPEVT
jgi:hypothetical protein